MRIALLLCCLIGAMGVAFAHPGASIHVAKDGRVFFVDTGGGVFVIDRKGNLVRHAGSAFHWFALDETSRLAKTRWPAIPNGDLESAGMQPTVVLSSDFPVAVGGDGALYYPQPDAGTRWKIVRVDPSGATRVRATFEGPRRSNAMGWVNGIAAGDDDALYVSFDREIHKFDARGRKSTIARDVRVPGCVRIPGVEAELGPYLRGLDVAPDGTVFVAAAGCGAVLMVSPDGVAKTVLRTSAPYSPTAVAVANGEVFVLEYLHTPGDDRSQWIPRVRKITREGQVDVLVRKTR